MQKMGNIKSETNYTYIMKYIRVINIWRNGHVQMWIVKDASHWYPNMRVFIKKQKI